MSPTTSTPDAPASPDEARVELAVAALEEITEPGDVGALVAVVSPEPGVVDLRFACTLAGYPDWHWTVSTSNLEGVATTVLEVELLPAEGALLAPAWVPWTERLAEWRRTHPDEPADAADEDDADEDEDEVDPLDEDETDDALDDVEGAAEDSDGEDLDDGDSDEEDSDDEDSDEDLDDDSDLDESDDPDEDDDPEPPSAAR